MLSFNLSKKLPATLNTQNNMSIEEEIFEEFRLLSHNDYEERKSTREAENNLGVGYRVPFGKVYRVDKSQYLRHEKDSETDKIINDVVTGNDKWDTLIQKIPKIYESEKIYKPKNEKQRLENERKRKVRQIHEDLFFKDWRNQETILHQKFFDHYEAEKYLAQKRWSSENPVCPYCGYNHKIYRIEKGKRFKCGNPKCHKKFSVTVGTIFQNGKLPLVKWFSAMYLIAANDRKRVGSAQLSRLINVSQKTAWYIISKLEQFMDSKDIEIINIDLFRINIKDFKKRTLTKRLKNTIKQLDYVR